MRSLAAPGSYDQELARRILQKVRESDPDFQPVGQAAPIAYRLAFRWLGFEAAEALADNKRKLAQYFFRLLLMRGCLKMCDAIRGHHGANDRVTLPETVEASKVETSSYESPATRASLICFRPDPLVRSFDPIQLRDFRRTRNAACRIESTGSGYMKIHCIVLTKNEEDVVGHCLKEASVWADQIYVYDGTSTDATWDIVKSLESDKIVPWKQDGKVFSEGLRAEVFNEFRHLSDEQDWWLQLNVDEFYPSSYLREMLGQIPIWHDFVWGIPIEYYLTWKDLETVDFSLSAEQRLPKLRWFRIDWSEPRCFRYRRRLVWKNAWAWPRHPGVVARQRILFKHYPYRSPQQIQTRLNTRIENRERGFPGWAHAAQASWKEKIVDSSTCQFDDGSGRYAFDETALPHHIEPGPRRLIKSFMHRSRIWR